MRASDRGGFLLLRGASGAGKSTFLHTVGMFRESVESMSIDPRANVRETLHNLPASNAALRIIVLEEREALRDISVQELERDLHAINGFIRSTHGERCLIVWPCNTEELQARIVEQAYQIGADALLGIGEPVFHFSGPRKDQFRRIAERTVAVLNEGASLADLGISDSDIDNLIIKSGTVGTLLGHLRNEIFRKRGNVESLLAKEQCKLWIIVAAGNDPDRDVAALTRGQYAAIDIERLMSSTDANIVQDLKAYPDRLGILGMVLDAKIFHLPMLTALDIARQFANTDLRSRMQQANLADRATPNCKALERLENTDLARVMNSGAQGTMSPGGKPGSNTEQAFKKLVSIAQSSDTAINRAVAEALLSAKYISSYEVEKDLGKGLKRRTDIYCPTPSGAIRIELMWRSRTSRAEIANYVLTKLYNYGRAIEFLE